jgi:hypothetical protein
MVRLPGSPAAVVTRFAGEKQKEKQKVSGTESLIGS